MKLWKWKLLFTCGILLMAGGFIWEVADWQMNGKITINQCIAAVVSIIGMILFFKSSIINRQS